MHKLLSSSALLLLLSACGQSLDQELDAWCACEQKAAKNEAKIEDCDQMIQEISDKYAFDPEAVPQIKEAIEACH